MSTFTNILQQKINNLEAQIRQLQEQNVQLRNKARWLMEAAASSDMSMLQPTVQNEPMGQSTGANQNSTYTMNTDPILPYGPTPTNFPSDIKEGEYLGDNKGRRNQFYWDSVNGRWIIHVYNARGKIVRTYAWNGDQWVDTYI